MSNGSWPKLGDFPLTNAIGMFTLVAWSVTGFAALIGVPFGYRVPSEWWEALKWISAYAFAQFTAKRLSNGMGVNGNSSPRNAPRV